MSSKTSRKATTSVPKAPEPILTRTKSAQQRRQLRKKDKKNEKPKLTKPEIKSPKLNKSGIYTKDNLLKSPVKKSIEVIEQVEYYPNKLKRDISTKKIMLKPKHNFKVIAATNKRKLATPQKGIKSPTSKKQESGQNILKSTKRSRITTRPRSSPELSMQDMVRIMEETGSLSDEDFMEILTCPSPVWWEDPPDGRYDEDSIYTRSPERPPKKTNKETKKRKMTSNATSTNTKNGLSNIVRNTKQKEQLKATETKKDERFVKKKLKLENILGNIKNKNIQIMNEINRLDENKVKHEEMGRNRKVSDSEGDISDLSFNEEEILKNLENMDIPVEKPIKDETKIESVVIKKEEEIDVGIKEEIMVKKENVIQNEIKNEYIEMEIPPLEVKPEIKDELSIKSSVSDIDSIPGKNIQSIRDVSLGEMGTDKNTNEIFIVDSFTNSSLGNNEDSNSLLDIDSISNVKIVNNSSKKLNEVNSRNAIISNAGTNNNDLFPNKKTINDLSEYITVYKIIPEKNNSNNNLENDSKPTESIKKTKLDTVRGKLNDFFKQCKNKRLKKSENPIPAITVTDVKQDTIDNEKENGDTKIDSEDEKNRLKCCDFCIEKTENGTTDFFCEKCETAPILPCGLCNFLADTKEIYRKHVSSCKDVARIPWSHNYVLNQT